MERFAEFIFNLNKNNSSSVGSNFVSTRKYKKCMSESVGELILISSSGSISS